MNKPSFVNYIYRIFCLIALSYLFSGCLSEDEEALTDFSPQFDRIITFNFSKDTDNWEGSLSGYFQPFEDSLQFEYQQSELPASLKENRTTDGHALKWSVNNYLGQELFLFAHRKISNLEPNTQYSLGIILETGFQVLGGNPLGLAPNIKGISLKSGAVNFEPKIETYTLNDSLVSVNFDKGIDSNSNGIDLFKVGELIVGDPSFSNKMLVTSEDPALFNVMTNNRGELWLLVGAELNASLFLDLYIDSIIIYLKQVG